jgi:hypothetical protein
MELTKQSVGIDVSKDSLEVKFKEKSTKGIKINLTILRMVLLVCLNGATKGKRRKM